MLVTEVRWTTPEQNQDQIQKQFIAKNELLLYYEHVISIHRLVEVIFGSYTSHNS